MKNVKLRICAALLALVMCMGMLVGCEDGLTVKDVTKDPVGALVTGFNNYIDSLLIKNNVDALAEKLKTGTGTYHMSQSMMGLGDLSVDAVIDGKSLTGSGKVSVGVMGISTDISVWKGEEELALKAPVIFGDTAYGLNLKTLETQIESSGLLEMMDVASYAELDQLIADTYSIDISDLIDPAPVKEKLEEALSGTAPTVAEEKFKVGEKEISAISALYALNTDQLMGVADVIPVADISADLKEAIGDIDMEISLKLYLNVASATLLGVDIAAKDTANEQNYAKISVNLGEDVMKTLDVSVTAELSDAEGGVKSTSVTLKEITEEGKDGFIAEAKNGAGESLGSVSFTRTVADGKYEFKTVDHNGDTVTQNGTLIHSESEFTLSVDTMTTPYGETAEVGTKVSIKAGGTVEAVPEYTDILGMTADALTDLEETFGASSLLSMILGFDMGGMDDSGDYGDWEDIAGEDWEDSDASGSDDGSDILDELDGLLDGITTMDLSGLLG